MKSHYKAYVEEIEPGATVEEFDWGFFKYVVAEDNIFISDLYVVPEMRGKATMVSVGQYLEAKARELNLKYLTTIVTTSTVNATDNLRKYITFGFVVFKTDERAIYMVKNLEVNNG